MGSSLIVRRAAYLFSVFIIIFGFYFWLKINFLNPYVKSSSVNAIVNTFILIVVPAILSLVSVYTKRPALMYIAVILALPAGFYLALTPGIFKWYGLILGMYLCAAGLMFIGNRIKQ
jgi:hypothetical protein